MKHGFRLIDEKTVAEIGSKAYLYRHVKTGAELLSVENNDSNKVFGISFKTPPANSTGIAHILEHSVLCGSRKYPAKDPFVQLLKGSLQTFLNAMTYPDKTVYPVASQNPADFHNLVDVYLDAVFYPRITPEMFQQEGWHYEIDPESGRLSYKGVVYNETKGNYSSPDSLVHEYSQTSLFPDNTYGLDSGGDPEAIPDLCYEEFKRFHANNYHPSNARLFFWGDDDPAERLRKSAEYLDDFEAREVDSEIALQAKFGAPLHVEKEYASEDGDGDDNQVTLNWMLPEVEDLDRLLSFDILAHLLIGTPAAPLRKALIDSGLGDDITGCGLETATRQMFFSTGLKGVKSENLDKIEPLIMDTLAQLVSDGFNPELIEAAMNTLEFHLRENNTGKTPRGLVVMLRTLKLWLHGRDPLAAMNHEPALERLKSIIENDRRHFEKLLEKHFLCNSHRTTLFLNPNPDLGRYIEQKENARLENIRSLMTAEDLAEIEKNQERLQKIQHTPDSPETLAKIPALSLADVEKRNTPIPARKSEAFNAEVLHHDIFTNGILYLDAGFSLDALEADDLPYLGLLCNALVDVGTTEQDYSSLIRRIGRDTGGIAPSLFIASKANGDRPAAYLHLRGKTMADKAPAMLELFHDILLKANLDDQNRMLQIALETRADTESDLIPAGHLVVNERLHAKGSLAASVKEQTSGTEFLLQLRRIIGEIKDDWESTRERLKSILHKILNRAGMHCNATIDDENWQATKPLVEEFMANFEDRQYEASDWPVPAETKDEVLTIPSQVQYVGKAVQVNRQGMPASGAELVVTRYLRTAWLWEQIRVQGGAYGAISTLGFFSGIFSMASYRDPQIDRTLDVYDKTGDYLQKLKLDQKDLERAIIGAIGDMDKYKLPDAKGYTALARELTGRSEELLQKTRDQILATRPEDFGDFGRKLQRLKDEGSTVILGSKTRIADSAFARDHRNIKTTEVL